jgi:hypothetical protein
MDLIQYYLIFVDGKGKIKKVAQGLGKGMLGLMGLAKTKGKGFSMLVNGESGEVEKVFQQVEGMKFANPLENHISMNKKVDLEKIKLLMGVMGT